MYRTYFKPTLDFLIAMGGVLLLSPIFVIVTISLFIANKGKPFFLQTRPGKGEKLFRIIKFKTMNDRTDSNGKLLSDIDRLTPIGSFVRRTSLDEIPQLLNVIAGDMSLIGPRPLLVDYLSLYTEYERRRHDVRPGITGWAQVNGRNSINWKSKFDLDIYYVDNVSFILDCKIFIMTIHRIVASKDINIVPVKRLVDEKKEQNESRKIER